MTVGGLYAIIRLTGNQPVVPKGYTPCHVPVVPAVAVRAASVQLRAVTARALASAAAPPRPATPVTVAAAAAVPVAPATVTAAAPARPAPRRAAPVPARPERPAAAAARAANRDAMSRYRVAIATGAGDKLPGPSYF